MIYDVVDATKVVNCLYDIIYVDGFIGNSDSVRFKNVSRLVVSQFATFNMVGVIGQVYLCSVVDVTFRAVRSEMPYFWENSITDIYSIFLSIGKF